MTVYLDCNASTPPDLRVLETMWRCYALEHGNAGSPHEFGRRAKEAANLAREQVGALAGARRHEVVFTSGATESNNLALLGLAEHGQATGRRHIVSTQIEHKSVLEPLELLRHRGFEITLLPPNAGGRVSAGDIVAAVRDDTLLASVQDVNNETGVSQPISEIADALADKNVFLHVDAAQGFGKTGAILHHQAIDLISISGHKIYGPQGIGALIVRRRKSQLPPLAPLLVGGGQEFGLRPGTLPVALALGLGKAAELAGLEANTRAEKCRAFRKHLWESLDEFRPTIHGDPNFTAPHVLNLSFPNVDSEQAIEALAGLLAVSNGSACTSVCATASHVLAAMGVAAAELDGALRFSWMHDTPTPDWEAVRGVLRECQAASNASSR